VNCNEIRNFTREFFGSRNAVAFHTKHHSGNLRHLVFRTARDAKSVMAAMTCYEGTIPEQELFVKELTAAFPEVESVMKFHNINKGGAAVAGAASCLHGTECITEEIQGIKLEVSAESFMQTNTFQAERLYSTLIEMCEIEGNETLLDLYSGAGPIALLAAKKAGRVIAIESVESSIADARRNAALNEIGNVEFVCGEVEKLLGDIINEAKPAAVIVDPPRAGLHKKAVASIVEAAPERLMYVSCNPATLARDTVDFVAGGYTLEEVRPVDMFPHTYHIECVARFTKK
jgi:23S rRNA (uracil1939-C5)-methyltransferase